ncbi:trifunctional histidinol dehydrogenase/phosphoribosyl-AMP cyclohydrolase/phosphoribosyl-ATP diphosphatase [Martiniozyma asiatica (nom. inval.)]|nr:trifunctional histidinol dehydrogenase/phosphoribosyl-AMP cyclohydrolase/phosphoribosyl-ATP diphosphatase [Martiniozyma asiatica]
MVFPLLPYFASVQDVKDSLAISGQILISYSTDSSLVAFSKVAPYTVHVDYTNPSVTEEDIVALLSLYNNGVESVFATNEIAQEILRAIPNARITYKSSNSIVPNQKNALTSTESIETIKISQPGQFFIFAQTNSDIKSLVSKGFVVIVDSTLLTNEYENIPAESYALVDFLLPVLVTDRPDGLFTTMVVDQSNQALGLVYSSKKSISEAIKTQTGVYQSRKHGLWYKGATSGATQKLIAIDADCDNDCVKVIVEQSGAGFCHFDTNSCFGEFGGLSKLEKTLVERKENAPEGSYTKRLFNDEKLLCAKIKEEAEELTDANNKEEIAWEAADLFYFALARCVKYGVGLKEIEKNLDMKSLKVTRRKGDAKPKFIEEPKKEEESKETIEEKVLGPNDKIYMNRIDAATSSVKEVEACLERPIQKSADIMSLVTPIVEKVKTEGDKALIELTAKFDKVQLDTPVLTAPFPEEMMQITDALKEAIDISFENIRKFHEAQNQTDTLVVETSPGVFCSRFARPIERVGCYIPGGTAVLPSTSLMLSVPALVAGCKDIIFASPPGKDGKLTPEVVYVAHKVGAKCIVLAGGAQAVASMAYGTETIPKCDKIMGPGNQFVTAAKMLVANDSNAMCAIDMPAGPSEVLVICDKYADPDFVASDLLSQAEHGVDSQVILLAVDMTSEEVDKIDEAVHRQALALPRVEIVRKCIAHSTTIQIPTMEQAFSISNKYAPEHLILQIENAESWVPKVDNAGSIFVGAYSPESCGDYSSGTNHTLPTYGYARMYSGVNTATFQKFITSQVVTKEGLNSIGKAVMDLAEVEGLDGHRNAVYIRMQKLGTLPEGY